MRAEHRAANILVPSLRAFGTHDASGSRSAGRVARGVDHVCLIVTSGRVGSNWLLSMLSQSPSVYALGELLSINARHHPDCPPDTCGVDAPPDGAIDRVFSWMDRMNNYTKTSLFKSSGPI